MMARSEDEIDSSSSRSEKSAGEEQSDATIESEHEEDNNEEVKASDATAKMKRPKKIHKLSLTETEDFNKKLKKRGVIYVARVPPRMTPTKIKSLLSDFAEVTRVYLVEEDATVRKRRKKEYGSSGGKRYIEGWVEFASKRMAKHIAESLNVTPISNHKRNPHYGKLNYVIDQTREDRETKHMRYSVSKYFANNWSYCLVYKAHYGILNISISSSGRI